MLLILSGPQGVGKSTVCERIVSIARSRGFTCGGVLTLKTPDGGIFIRDLSTGEETTFAGLVARPDVPRTGRFYFEPAGLAFGMDAIRRGLTADLLVIDELGILEARGEGFADAFPLIDSRDQPTIVIIREWLLDELRPRFSRPGEVVSVSVSQRDLLPASVMETLFPA